MTCVLAKSQEKGFLLLKADTKKARKAGRQSRGVIECRTGK